MIPHCLYCQEKVSGSDLFAAHPASDIIDQHEGNQEKSQITVHPIEDIDKSLIGEEAGDNASDSSSYDGQELVLLRALRRHSSHAGPKQRHGSRIDSAEDDDSECLGEKRRDSGREDQGRNIRGGRHVNMHNQRDARENRGPHDENGGEKHARVDLGELVLRSDFREEGGKPEDYEASVGGTRCEGISPSDLSKLIFSRVHRLQILLEIPASRKERGRGDHDDDDDDERPQLPEGIQNPVETEDCGGDDSNGQNHGAHAVWKSPLLRGRGIGSAAHDDKAHIAKECRKIVVKAPDILSAVVLIDVTAPLDLKPGAVGCEGEIRVNINYRDYGDHDRKLGAIGGLVLHDLLHGRKARADVKRDTGPAESDNRH